MKNILLYIFICSIVLFINCGEDIESEITPINTGLYDNQSLLIGNCLVDKIDGESINEFCVLGECLDVDHQFIFSFDSNPKIIGAVLISNIAGLLIVMDLSK